MDKLNKTLKDSIHMKSKGFISSINFEKRFYNISTFSKEIVIMMFDEMVEERLKQGDIIEFKLFELKNWGKNALEPVKIGNIYLDELKESLINGNSIEAYIKCKIEGGFFVSYKGYDCFLPNHETIYREVNDTIEVETITTLYVRNIDNTNVFLTRKPILKKLHSKLANEEISRLEVGFEFTGKIKSVKGYGVFISFKHSEGLLHLSKILKRADNNSNQEKIIIQKNLSKYFLKVAK